MSDVLFQDEKYKKCRQCSVRRQVFGNRLLVCVEMRVKVTRHVSFVHKRDFHISVDPLRDIESR